MKIAKFGLQPQLLKNEQVGYVFVCVFFLSYGNTQTLALTFQDIWQYICVPYFVTFINWQLLDSQTSDRKSQLESEQIEIFENNRSINVKLIFLAEMVVHKHVQFISRTVLVKNNNIEQACGILNRIMGKEDLLDQYRRTRFYEKPTQVRRRINYERCKAFYNEDMQRKIQMVLRKNRTDPFPGCNWSLQFS